MVIWTIVGPTALNIPFTYSFFLIRRENFSLTSTIMNNQSTIISEKPIEDT